MTELNLDYTKTMKIVSFDISGVRLVLFKSAVVNVIFTCDDGNTIHKELIIEGDEYLKWSSDDNFIIDYIVKNSHEILNK